MTKALVIPDEIYVTAKINKEHEYNPKTKEHTLVNEYFFAFLHPHEPNKKTDENRKQTQLGWAYGPYKFEDDILIQLKHKWDYENLIDGRPQCIHYQEVAPFQPRVIKNEPLTGFQVFEVVSRYSTNNKLFRVEDPRGFVTEISAKSLLGIILEGSIEKGVIQSPCVWQANKNLVVYKERQ